MGGGNHGTVTARVREHILDRVLETHHQEAALQYWGHTQRNVVLALPVIGDLQTWSIYVEEITQERKSGIVK
jgi:hypothetical protein